MNDMVPISPAKVAGAAGLSGVAFCSVNFMAQKLADVANVAYHTERHGGADYHRGEIDGYFAKLADLLGYRLVPVEATNG